MDLRFEGTLEEFRKILEEEVFEQKGLLEENESDLETEYHRCNVCQDAIATNGRGECEECKK